MSIDPDSLVDDSLDVARTFEEGRIVQRVHEVFALLHRVTIRHAVEEESLQDIAKDLNLPVSTVRRAWDQARDILREHL